jgi:Caspase domain
MSARIKFAMRVIFRAMIAFALCLLPAAPTLALPSANPEPQGRLAFVVGNWDYTNLIPLKNPGRNSELVAESLQNLGFDVSQRQNLTRKGFEEAIKEISGRAAGYESVLFYFSGHAFQLEGRNFLVPVDAKLGSPKRLREETIAFDDLVSQIHDIGRQTLFFLDASGANPIPKSTNAGKREAGLAQIEQVRGTFIAFAAQPGNAADEGTGENSPFSLALAENMEAEGISISDMMIRVRNTVEEQTQQRQTPWDQSSLRSQFYFKPLIENSESLTEDDLGLLTQLDPVLLDKFQKRFGLDLSGGAGGSGAPVIATVRPTLRIEEADPEEPVSVLENAGKQESQPDAETAAANYETVKPGILILGADDAEPSGERAINSGLPEQAPPSASAAPNPDIQLALAAAAQQSMHVRNLRVAETGEDKLPSTQTPAPASLSTTSPKSDISQEIVHQKIVLPPKPNSGSLAPEPSETNVRVVPQGQRAPETTAPPSKAGRVTPSPKPEISAEIKPNAAKGAVPASNKEPAPPMSARTPEVAVRAAADRQPPPLPKSGEHPKITPDAAGRAAPASKIEPVISAPPRELESASQTAVARQTISSLKPSETAEDKQQRNGMPTAGKKPETVFTLPQTASADPEQIAKADQNIFSPTPNSAKTAYSRVDDRTAQKPLPAAPRAAPAGLDPAPKLSATSSPAAPSAAETALAAQKLFPASKKAVENTNPPQQGLSELRKARAATEMGSDSAAAPQPRTDSLFLNTDVTKPALPPSNGKTVNDTNAAIVKILPLAADQHPKESAAEENEHYGPPGNAAAVKNVILGGPNVQASNSFGLAPTLAPASDQSAPSPSMPATAARLNAVEDAKTRPTTEIGAAGAETALPGSTSAPADSKAEVQMAAIDPSNPRYSPLGPAQEPLSQVKEPDLLTPEAEQPSRRAFALRAQQELERLGCYRSALDGNWSARSARALLRYYAERRINPDEVEPSQKLIDLLSSEQTVVCKTTKAANKPKKIEPRPAVTVSKPKAVQATRKPAEKVKPAPVVRAAPAKPKIVATTKTVPPKAQVKSPISKPITGLFR